MKILNERGFMLLQVVFLAMITSIVAMIFLNGVMQTKNRNATLRLTAIHLANEQIAELESRAAQGILPVGSVSWLGVDDDLTTYNSGAKVPVKFDVKTNVANFSDNSALKKVTVKVEWKIGEEKFQIESEKVVREKISKPEP